MESSWLSSGNKAFGSPTCICAGNMLQESSHNGGGKAVGVLRRCETERGEK